jgi:regulatory protein
MPTITALKQQQRNDQRVSVFLDDTFAFGLPEPLTRELAVGQSLSAENIAELQRQADIHAALENAYRLLAHRPRSSAEIQRALHKKTYAPETIDAVLTQLQTQNYLDDRAFADYWVEQRNTFRPRSHLALRQELGEKGIAREIIEVALENVDEEEGARRVAEKQATRWANLPEREFRMKAGRFLQGRGYAYDVIRVVIDDLWQSIQTERIHSQGDET